MHLLAKRRYVSHHGEASRFHRIMRLQRALQPWGKIAGAPLCGDITACGKANLIAFVRLPARLLAGAAETHDRY
jgi:hypothetical protein